MGEAGFSDDFKLETPAAFAADPTAGRSVRRCAGGNAISGRIL